MNYKNSNSLVDNVFRKRIISSTIAVSALFFSSMSSADFSCELNIVNQWQGGAIAEINVLNAGTTPADMQSFSLSLPGDVSITNAWEFELSGNNPYTFTPYSHNQSFQAGATRKVGMQLSGDVSDLNPIFGGDCAPVISDNNPPVIEALNCQELTVEGGDFQRHLTIRQETAICTAEVSDPDGDTLTHSYDWGEGTTSAFGQHVYQQAGEFNVTLTVSDGELEDRVIVPIAVQGNSVPPTAHITCENNSDFEITCDASGSTDPDNELVYSYVWGDGTFTKFHGSTTASHTYSEAGNYTVQVDVSDENYVRSSTTTVSISDELPQFVEFTFELNGHEVETNVSTPGWPAGTEFIWRWGDGTETVGGPNASHTYTEDGFYTILLIASLPDHARAALKNINIQTGGFVPGLACSLEVIESTEYRDILALIMTNTSQEAILGWHVTVTYPNYNTEVRAAQNTWQIGSRPAEFINTANNAVIPVGGNTADVPLLTVEHDYRYSREGDIPTLGGDCDPNAGPVNHAPVITESSVSVNEYTLSAHSLATDADNDEITYFWSFGDGSISNEPSPSHTYDSAGAYTVKLWVSDGRARVEENFEINVTGGINQKPTALMTLSTESLSVSGDASESFDLNEDPLSYRWSWGDGNTSSGVTARHVYKTPGEYTVTLTVNDGDLEDTITEVIIIEGDLSTTPYIQCDFNLLNSWTNGFSGSVVLTNVSEEPVSGWSIVMEFTDGSKIVSAWNVRISGDNPYTLEDVGWNGMIAPGDSINFGLQGDGRGSLLEFGGNCISN